ncbi:MAG: hypothetical protein ACRBI6_14630 [Acidimicrobiales bacterium]
MLLAVIWHFWIGVALAVGAVFTVIGLVAGYFAKVQHPKYPKKP